MEAKFGKGVKTPVFNIEQGAELECWRKFIKRFEIAMIGAGIKKKEHEGVQTKRSASAEGREIFAIEQRKAALLLDSMGEYGMNIFETWHIEVEAMQYEKMKTTFEEHFSSRENIVATRHRFLGMEQKSEERLDKFIERVERRGSTCRWGGLEEELNVQVVIKGMHVDKIRNELLLKKDMTLSKVKGVCNRYESARAASKILQKTEPVPISEVDEVAVKIPDNYSQEGEQENIDRVGASNYSGGFNSGFRGRGYGRGRGRGRGRGCYTCGGFGHDYKECKEKKEREMGVKSGNTNFKCYVCGDTRHLAKFCPNRFGQKDPSKSKVNAVAGYSSESEESL